MIVACDPGSAEGAIVALDLVDGRWHMVAGGAWSLARRKGGDVMRVAGLHFGEWTTWERAHALEAMHVACSTVSPGSIRTAVVEGYTAGKRSKGATNLRHLFSIGDARTVIWFASTMRDVPDIVPPGVWRRTLGVKPRTSARQADKQIRAVVAERVTIPDGAPRWAWRSLPDAAGLGLHLAEHLHA